MKIVFTKKLILDERLVLDEASTKVKLDNTNRQLQTIKNTLDTILKSITAITDNQTKTNTNKTNTPPNELWKNRATLIKEWTTQIKSLSKMAASLADIYKKLGITKTDASKIQNANFKDIADLQAQLEALETQVLPALSAATDEIKGSQMLKAAAAEIENIDSILTDNINKTTLSIFNNEIVKMYDKVVDRVNAYDNVENFIPSDIADELTAQLDDLLESLKDTFITILDSDAVLDSNDKSVFEQKLETCKAKIADINSTLDKVILDTDSATRQASNDWAARFKAASSDKDQTRLVWNEYLDTVWKTKHKDLTELANSLGRSFIKSLSAVGYTPETNPIIKFVIDNSSLVEKHFLNDNSKFMAILNAAINGVLNDDDLLGTGSLKKDNIIFCPDFYDLSSDQMTQYLELQSNVVHTFKNENVAFNYQSKNAVENDEVTTYLTQKYPKSDVNKFFNDLFYLPGQPFSTQDDVEPGNINNGLKDYVVIANEFKRCFGKAAATADTTKNDQIIINDINKEEVISRLTAALDTKADTKQEIATQINTCKKLINILLTSNDNITRVDQNNFYDSYPSTELADVILSKEKTDLTNKYFNKINIAKSNKESIREICEKLANSVINLEKKADTMKKDKK